MEKKKYWIKDLTENQVIHAPTKKIAKKLCKKFHELGLRWNAGDSYLELVNWKNYGEDTAYNPNLGMYADLPWYMDVGFEVLTIDDLLDFEPNLVKNEDLLHQNFLESAEYYAQITQCWLDKLPDTNRYSKAKDLAKRLHGAIVDELCLDGFLVKESDVSCTTLVGAKSQNFVLKNIVVSPNAFGDRTRMDVSSFKLEHNELSIYGIGSVWVIDGCSFRMMDDSKHYYLYAECSKTTLTGVVKISEDPIATDNASNTSVWNFNIGVLYSAQSGWRSFEYRCYNDFLQNQ